MALGGLAVIGVATVGIAYGVKKGKIRTEKIKQEIEQRLNYITEQENIQNLKLQKNKTMIQKYEALLRKEGLSNQDKIAVYNRLSALIKHGKMISGSCITPDRNKAYYLAQQNASRSVKVINHINELVAQVKKEGVTPATQEKMSGLVKELEKYEDKKFKSIQKAIDYAAKEKMVKIKK